MKGVSKKNMIFMSIVSKTEMCMNRIGLMNELSLFNRTSEINMNLDCREGSPISRS